MENLRVLKSTKVKVDPPPTEEHSVWGWGKKNEEGLTEFHRAGQGIPPRACTPDYMCPDR